MAEEEGMSSVYNKIESSSYKELIKEKELVATPQEKLEEELELNSRQLRELYAIYEADRLNIILYLLLIIGLVTLFCFFVAALVSPLLNSILRPEITELSGALSILTALGIWQLFRSYYVIKLRSGELKSSIAQQKAAIYYAKKVLNDDDLNHKTGPIYGE